MPTSSLMSRRRRFRSTIPRRWSISSSGVSRTFRSAQGRHLLRHHQSPGCGQTRCAGGRRHDRCRRAEFVEFAAAEGSRRACRLSARGADAARCRDRHGAILTASPGSASPPALRRPKFWSRRSSTRLPSATSVDVETVTATEEGVFFPLPRPLRDNEAAE